MKRTGLVIAFLIFGLTAAVRAQFTIAVDVTSQDRRVEREVEAEIRSRLASILDVAVLDEKSKAEYLVLFFIARADDDNDRDPRFSFSWSIGRQALCTYAKADGMYGRPVPCNALLLFNTVSTGNRRFLKAKISELGNNLDSILLSKLRKTGRAP